MEITNRNFFRLIADGTFGSHNDIEPMSAYKWEHLVLIGEAENLLPFLKKGINIHQKDNCLNIPDSVYHKLDGIEEFANNKIALNVTHGKEKYKMPQLSYIIGNIKLKKIVYNEYHSIDTSIVSLNILELIIRNTANIMTSGVSLHEIINLGLFLRQHGHNVDFVKVETWLDKLGLKQMANLQANILTSFLGFEDDEIPFMLSKDDSAMTMVTQHIDGIKSTIIPGEDNEIKKASKRKIRNAIRCFRQTPTEAVCRTFSNLAKNLSEIEE